MSKILIVDDRPTNRQFFVTLLGYKNHNLLEASDGEEGLQLARTEHPDLIISDVLMPTMDGYEFVKQLRSDSATKQIPVIFSTAHFLCREAQALAESCGVSSIIYKPCEPEEVLKAVDTTLGEIQTEEQKSSTPGEDFDREHLKLITDKLAEKAIELRVANQKLSAMFDLCHQLETEHESIQLLEKFCKVTREVIGAKWVAIGIRDDSQKALKHFRSIGLDNNSAGQLKILSEENETFSALLKEEQPCRVNKINGNLNVMGLPDGFLSMSSFLSVPLISQGRNYGWLCVADKLGTGEFKEEDEQLAVTLASKLIVTYENTLLYGESKSRAAELELEIAERKHAQNEQARLHDQLKSESQRLNNIVDTLPGVVWEFWGKPDIATNQFNFVSDYVEKMLGYTVEEFFSTPNFRFQIIHPDDLERIVQETTALYEKAESGTQEFRIIAKDGRTVWVEMNFIVITDENGNPVGMRGFTTDITERKYTEEALRKSEVQFRQAQKMEAVGQLAGGVAHDFNNLLTVIIGCSELLLSKLSPDNPNRKLIDDILYSGERGAALTSQLLAFSRKQILEPKILNVNDTVKSVEKMLHRLIEEDITLTTVLDASGGKIKVDPGQIEQVIMNLAINARDAMPHGGKLTIETYNVELENENWAHEFEYSPGRYVMLAITDTGCGMTQEVKEHIFEPFFSTKEQGKGTGLGLATVYGIVKQSGGFITVYSEVGVGSTFKIYFPEVTEEDATATVISKASTVEKSNETLLLVEDNANVKESVKLILEANGYKVLEADSGQSAVEIFETYKGIIHLVVTDVVMPEMSGRELAEVFRARHKGLKVLYMSGYTDDAILRHGIIGSNEAFLQKPFSMLALVKKVRKVLDS